MNNFFNNIEYLSEELSDGFIFSKSLFINVSKFFWSLILEFSKDLGFIFANRVFGVCYLNNLTWVPFSDPELLNFYGGKLSTLINSSRSGQRGFLIYSYNGSLNTLINPNGIYVDLSYINRNIGNLRCYDEYIGYLVDPETLNNPKFNDLSYLNGYLNFLNGMKNWFKIEALYQNNIINFSYSFNYLDNFKWVRNLSKDQITFLMESANSDYSNSTDLTKKFQYEDVFNDYTIVARKVVYILHPIKERPYDDLHYYM